jgi:putative resolvase
MTQQVETIETAAAPAAAPQMPFNGKRFLKLAECAEFLGVSQSTARELADGGRLGNVTLTPGGHRRMDSRSVFQYAYGQMPEESTNKGTNGRLIAYARVSSRKQASKTGNAEQSSLQNQIDILNQFCQTTYGREPEVLSDVGSGLNFERPSFLNIIRQIVRGELRGATLVVKDFSRLCRFGIKLVEFLAEFGGVEIVYAYPESADENETLATDVLEILCHFTARCSGNKARKALKVNLDSDALQKAYTLYKGGMSYRKIAKQFASEGLTDAKGRAYSASIVRKNLIENWGVLESGMIAG